MAEYLILIFGDEAQYEAGGEETFATTMKEHNEFAASNSAAIRDGKPLQPVATATTIRRQNDGTALVTDGPFVETKEALGGYYLIEAKDLDEAIAIAKQVPAPFGGVEVRPVMPLG